MKKSISYLLLFFLLGIINPVVAQMDTEEPNAELIWGKELKGPNKTFLSKIITSNKNGFYALREVYSKQPGEGVSKIYLEKYNKQMKLLKSEKIDLKLKGKKLELEEVTVIGGDLYVLSSFNNEAKRKNYLFAQKVNYKTLKISNNFKKIGEINTKNKYKEGSFDLHISKDSSKILVYNERPYKKKEQEIFTLGVFDNQFNELWTKKIRLPYPDKQFSIEEYQVDNQGNVYLLGMLFENGTKTKKKGKPNFRYEILAYRNQGEDVEEYPIELDELFISDLAFRIANDGTLICSGFYSEQGTSSVAGTYFLRIDPKTHQVFNKNTKKFDFEFLTQNVSDRKKAKYMKAEKEGNVRKKAELYRYSLDELILRNDGGAVLVAEQYYVDERQDFYDDRFYNGRFSNRGLGYGGGRTIDYYYNYNEIIVVNIRPNGEIQWTARIPKYQNTVNDGGYFSSYAMSIVRDKLYFVFNDNPKNFDPTDDRLHDFNGQRSIIALAQVNTKGEIKVDPIFSNKEANVLTRPKVSRQVGKREMIIYGENNRKFRFATLQFID